MDSIWVSCLLCIQRVFCKIFGQKLLNKREKVLTLQKKETIKKNIKYYSEDEKDAEEKNILRGLFLRGNKKEVFSDE